MSDFVDECETCFYCGDDVVEEDNHIKFNFSLPGSRITQLCKCCEICFWGIILEDGYYEDAAMVLTNRIKEFTGITAIDKHQEELMQAICELYAAKKQKESALLIIEKLQKEKSLDAATSKLTVEKCSTEE